MKNLVLQYYLPYKRKESTIPNWVTVGKKSAEHYANIIGSEYEFSNKRFMNSTLNVFESFRVFFDKTYDNYDNVLLLDVDTIVNTKESVFDQEIKDIALVHELGVQDRPAVPGANFGKKWWDEYFNSPKNGVVTYAKKTLDTNFEWRKSQLYLDEPFVLYNGGVQVWSKAGRLKARQCFDKTGHDKFHKFTKKGETPYLNMMLFYHKFNISELDNSWNRLNFQWQADGNLGKITHYNDIDKGKMLSHE